MPEPYLGSNASRERSSSTAGLSASRRDPSFYLDTMQHMNTILLTKQGDKKMYESVCSIVQCPILVQRLAPAGTKQSTLGQSSMPLFYRKILQNHACSSTHRLEALVLLDSIPDK